jgi:hypothetical protein
VSGYGYNSESPRERTIFSKQFAPENDADKGE